MREGGGIQDWEENTERRLGILESKVDKILDPQAGVYPLMRTIESRLKSWAISILTMIVVGIIVQVILYRHHP